MKTISNYLIASLLMFATLFTAVGCEEDADVDPSDDPTVTPDPDPDPDPDAELPTVALEATGNGTFEITVTNAVMYAYAYYLTEEAPSESLIEWTEVAVESDGAYAIETTSEVGDYTIYAYAGGLESDSAVISAEFVVSEPTAITVSCTPATLTIAMDVVVNLSLCDGFAWSYNDTRNYNPDYSYLLADLTYGYGNLVSESGTVMVGSDYYLSANTSYTIEVVAYNESESGDGTYVAVGDIITIECTTSPAVIGSSDVSVVIEIDDSETSITGFGGKVYNNSDVAGYYCGNVAVSDAPDGVEAWITSSSWFTGWDAYANAFYGMDYTVYEYVDAEYKTFTASNKSAGTEYIAFAIAIDNDGNLGNLSTVNVTTSTISSDPNIKPVVSVTPYTTTADFVFDFNGCAKVFRWNESVADASSSADDVYNNLLSDMSTMYYGWSSADYAEGSVSYTQQWLTMGTEYNMYYLGVGADGTLGELQVLNYKTVSPEYTSAATVNVTFDGENSQVYYMSNPELYPEYMDNIYAEVSFSVELQNGAASYAWGVFDHTYIFNQSSMAAFGDYLLGSFYNTVYTSETYISNAYFGSSDYVLVIVPIDAGGAYGTAQKFEFDAWDNPIYVEPDYGDLDGGGVMPGL